MAGGATRSECIETGEKCAYRKMCLVWIRELGQGGSVSGEGS